MSKMTDTALVRYDPTELTDFLIFWVRRSEGIDSGLAKAHVENAIAEIHRRMTPVGQPPVAEGEYLAIEEAMQMLLQAGVPARWSEYVKRIEDQMGDTYARRWQINAPGKQFRGDVIGRLAVSMYLEAAGLAQSRPAPADAGMVLVPVWAAKSVLDYDADDVTYEALAQAADAFRSALAQTETT